MLHTDYFEVVTDRPRRRHRTCVARVAEYLQNEPAQDQVDDLQRPIRSLPTSPDPEAEQSVESHRPVEVTHAQRTVMRPEHTTILHQQQAARSQPRPGQLRRVRHPARGPVRTPPAGVLLADEATVPAWLTSSTRDLTGSRFRQVDLRRT